MLADFRKFMEPYQLNSTFHKYMKTILESNEWDKKTFMENTQLADIFYTRLMKKPYYKFDKRTIVTICIALGLDIGITERLLALQGYTLSTSPDERLDLAYRFLFQCSSDDIDGYNDILEELGIDKKHHLGSYSPKF